MQWSVWISTAIVAGPDFTTTTYVLASLYEFNATRIDKQTEEGAQACAQYEHDQPQPTPAGYLQRSEEDDDYKPGNKAAAPACQ